jgi:hypothetical protein
MRINWEVVKPSLWTGAAGVVVGMLLLSNGFGFMSQTTAEKLAAASSEKAVIAVLAPVCADKFRALADVATRTAILVANKDNSYKMREAFPEALITLPGKTYPDSDLTTACAGLVLAPPKTANLKQ